jgi:biotin-(acetyl-CoA carboxylase) ligase
MQPGLKIGGALLHTSWSGGRFNVVVGIGLNVTNRQPTTCLEAILEEVAAASQLSLVNKGGGSTRKQQGESAGNSLGGTTQVSRAVPLIQREVLLARIITRLDEAFEVSL